MIGIYTRLSVEDLESNSIEHQIKEGENFAGDRLFLLYNEGQGVSGRAAIKDRPELDRLMKDIATGKITTVWFRNQNRLERNSETFMAFSSLAKRKKLVVYFGDKETDWNDPSNFFQSSILTALNSYQAELQSYQTKKVLLARVEEGKVHGKSTPLGYAADKGGYLIVNEEEKPTVEKIYEMCLEGKGSTTIRHWLNNNKIPTRYSMAEGSFKIKNKHTGNIKYKKKSEVIWSDTQIQSILKNPMYKGKRRWNDKLIDCPSIFNEFYWQQVQDQYKKNKVSNNTGKNVDHLYLLKGLLECSECERNYYGRRRVSKKDNFYMCSSRRYKHENCTNRSINIDALESFIWITLFRNNTIYNKVRKAFLDGGLDKNKVDLENKIKGYQKILKSLDKEYKRTIDLVVRGVVEEDDISETKSRVTRETNKINELLTNDEIELRTLGNETIILTQIKYDLDLGRPTGTDWDIINEIIGNGEFEEIGDLKRRKLAKDRFDQLNKIDKEKREKSTIIENTSFNKKKEILIKYLKRIYIQYNIESEIFVLKIEYNLPIKTEFYYIDKNYIGAFDSQRETITDWHFGNRHFTLKKIEETYNTLKNYAKVK